jgi:adenosylcobinamide kinase/adenosylcobinamide-phosphate guanylyltransferase
MGAIHLIIGGARSGKSTYAEKCANEASQQVLYLATAIVTDSDMAARIQRHRESRPKTWETIERFKGFDMLVDDERFIKSEVILLDCLTIMMTNLMFDEPINYDLTTQEVVNVVEQKIWLEIKGLLEVAKKHDKKLFVVSNEVGMGLVPPYKLGNYFRDISGRMNQRLAAIADDVTFVAVGLPLKLKGAK